MKDRIELWINNHKDELVEAYTMKCRVDREFVEVDFYAFAEESYLRRQSERRCA